MMARESNARVPSCIGAALRAQIALRFSASAGVSRSHPLPHDRHVRRHFGQHLQPQRRDTADAAIGD
jgi:hypothetical protein